MPQTRQREAKVKGLVASKNATSGSSKQGSRPKASKQNKNSKEPTAYERLYAKLKDKKEKLVKEVTDMENKLSDWANSGDEVTKEQDVPQHVNCMAQAGPEDSNGLG